MNWPPRPKGGGRFMVRCRMVSERHAHRPERVYTMFSSTGAMPPRVPQCGPAAAEGIPPHLDDLRLGRRADDTAKRATELGGPKSLRGLDSLTPAAWRCFRTPRERHFRVVAAEETPWHRITGVEGTLCWADAEYSGPGKAAKILRRAVHWKIAPARRTLRIPAHF